MSNMDGCGYRTSHRQERAINFGHPTLLTLLTLTEEDKEGPSEQDPGCTIACRRMSNYDNEPFVDDNDDDDVTEKE
ncbi:hypothetical protein Tco_0152797 [Tanacetum coccineum]